MKVYRILVRDSLSKRWFIILVVFPESWLGGKTQHRPRCGARTMRNSMPKKRRSRWHCGMHERREAVGLFLDLGAEQIIYSNWKNEEKMYPPWIWKLSWHWKITMLIGDTSSNDSNGCFFIVILVFTDVYLLLNIDLWFQLSIAIHVAGSSQEDVNSQEMFD